MKPAEYIIPSQNMLRTKAVGNSCHHYALNIPYYTHFTSPIRRYADLMVHRTLQLSLELEQNRPGYPDTSMNSRQDLEIQAALCNEKRLNAKKAQEECDLVFLMILARGKKKKGLRTQATVLSYGANSCTLYFSQWGFEK